MEKLCRVFCLAQNSCSDKNSESIEKCLQDWKLPPSSAYDIYKRNGIFNCSSTIIKTVEEEIPLSEGYASFTLLSDDLKRTYRKFNYLHLGMVQVGLKPTKLGSNKSAVICLRKKSTVLGMVESSLCDGPISFSYFNTGKGPKGYRFHLSDPDLSTSVTLDIKINGSSNMHGEEKTILMFRFHYNVMKDDNRRRMRSWSHFRDETGKTTLYVTKVAQGNRVVSRKIHWDQVSVPEIWMDENDPAASSSEAQGSARVDWKEVAEAHVLKVDVPGFNEEEVKVEVEGGGILQISGERSKEQEEENDKWHCSERSSGKFLRRVRLPENARLDELTAGLEKGVLTVTVPKEEVNKKREVKVKDVSG